MWRLQDWEKQNPHHTNRIRPGLWVSSLVPNPACSWCQAEVGLQVSAWLSTALVTEHRLPREVLESTWRYSEAVWTWSWVTGSRWPCLIRDVGQGDPRDPFQPQRFCDSCTDYFCDSWAIVLFRLVPHLCPSAGQFARCRVAVYASRGEEKGMRCLLH